MGVEQKVSRGARIAPPLEENVLPGRGDAQAEASQRLMTELRKGIEELKVFSGNPGTIHKGNEKQVAALIESLSTKAKVAGAIMRKEVGDTISAIDTDSRQVLLAKGQAISNLDIHGTEVGIIAALAKEFRAKKQAA